MYRVSLPAWRRRAPPGVLDGGVTLSFARPHRDDVLLAVGGLLTGVLLWSLGLHSWGGRSLLPVWTALIPIAVTAATELFRRSAPPVALLVATAAMIGDQFTTGSLATTMMFTDVMYAAVVYGTPASARRIPVITGFITVATTLVALVWIRQPEALLIGVVTGLVTFGPASTGASVRNHREVAEAARLRAEQTALLAEMDRREAVTAERSRMARELHDLVANHLSAIAIHSTAALSIGEPKAANEALTVIRENSVQGLAEMRRLIGLLRDPDAAEAPTAAPTLDGLEALLDQARTNGTGSGLTFALDDGRAPGQALPAPVELAAYRIVQESLTNALKHASPGEVAVRIAREPGKPLTVLVTSEAGDRSGPRAPGSGSGLVGMEERVALLGGTFAAGPAPAAGHRKIWQVRAELPVDEGVPVP